MENHARPIAPSQDRHADDRLWGVADVCRFLGVNERTLRQWRREDLTFPGPLPLPGRVVRWLPSTIRRWVELRAEAPVR